MHLSSLNPNAISSCCLVQIMVICAHSSYFPTPKKCFFLSIFDYILLVWTRMKQLSSKYLQSLPVYLKKRYLFGIIKSEVVIFGTICLKCHPPNNWEKACAKDNNKISCLQLYWIVRKYLFIIIVKLKF